MSWLLLCLAALGATTAHAGPASWEEPLRPVRAVPAVEVEGPVRKALRAEDEVRAAAGLAPRFAVPRAVQLTPQTHGAWEELPDGRSVWRLRLRAPGAETLSFGAGGVVLPPGARLWLLDADGEDHRGRPLTAQDVTRGELATPVVRTEDLVVEVVLPTSARAELRLAIDTVLVGYKRFGALEAPPSGACNVDVVCPQGDDWRDEIATVAVYGTGGGLFCTGFMVNNTAEDYTPYFQTAHHCEMTSSNAARMVVYWNFESPTCGAHGGGSLDDFQSGATWRAGGANSDFALLELDDMPDPDWGVAWAGWDNRGEDATLAVAIHHPSTDEKSISFEEDGTSLTSYFGNSSPGDSTHVRVADWDEGTTEGGSSGSPLFNQDGRVIGQLHGGSAACGNNESDWYGSFAWSWDRGSSSSSRLRDWLDPGSTGAEVLDTLVEGAASAGLELAPAGGQSIAGDPGGPWSPADVTWTVQNVGDERVDLSFSVDRSWIDLNRSAASLNAGQTTAVTLTPNAAAEALATGSYTATLTIDAGSLGTSTRTLALQVGAPAVIYEWDMSEDPGWSLQGDWEWGVPGGDGGKYGGPDPSSGYTGSRVLGYNLQGDYDNGMSPTHATLGPVDASDLSGVTLGFWRWLGVEEGKYDHARISVSTDGTTWEVVWENGDEVADQDWTWQELDLSAEADGADTLWIRWTMGSTDESWTYCGWNLDDVQIIAVEAGGGGGADGGADGGATSDGGAPGDDTGEGPTADPGADDDDDDDDGSKSISVCGCGAGGAPVAWAPALLAALALRRKRRAPRP